VNQGSATDWETFVAAVNDSDTYDADTLALYMPLAGGTHTGLVDFSGTTHYGVKLLSLTTAQRDALTPTGGEVIYNSTTGNIEGYDGAWNDLGGAGSAEVNDLTAAVTWANVPDVNIPETAVTQHEAAIDHDALTNFVANEHIDWTGASAGTIHATNYSKDTNEFIIIAVSDETSDLETGTAKVTFRMPYALTLSEVRAIVTTAATGSAIQVDINESGTTILSTKLTIDATEKTSETAATPPVISDSALADDAEITIDIDAVGSTTAGAGLKVYLIGAR
jgi:hypothetical protein